MTTWDEFSWDNVRTGVVYKFSSGKVLRRDKFTEGPVYVRDGLIIETPEKNDEVVRVDLGENTILAPGYIDLQVNGGFGIDLTSSLGEDANGLREVAANLVQYGVTSFCPTIVTTHSDNYKKILKNIKVFNGSREGAGCLGAHLEGPFIALSHKGAHDPNYIADFPKGTQDVDNMYGKELLNVAIVTLAPEKENAMSVIKYLRNKSIVVSIGHSNSSIETACQAVKNGASMVTHLYNSVTSFHHRNPGIIGLLGRKRQDEEPLYFGLLVDHIHLHKNTVGIAHNAQPSAIVLVSDGVAALGLPDGKHRLGSQIVSLSGSKVVIDGTNTLGGSVTPIDQCVRNYMEATGCSQAQALAAATYRPAQVLHRHASKGNIAPGAQADFVVLDDELNVLSTWIQGRLVHKSKII